VGVGVPVFVAANCCQATQKVMGAGLSRPGHQRGFLKHIDIFFDSVIHWTDVQLIELL